MSALINIWQDEKHPDIRLFDELSACIQEQIYVLTQADKELNKKYAVWWFPLVIRKLQQKLIFEDNLQDINLIHNNGSQDIQYQQSVGVEHLVNKLPFGETIIANQTVVQQVIGLQVNDQQINVQQDPDLLKLDHDAQLHENTSGSTISEAGSHLDQLSHLNLAEIILNQENSEYIEHQLRPLAAYNHEVSLSLDNLKHIKRNYSEDFNLAKLKVFTRKIKTRINDFTLLQREQNQEIVSQDGGLLLLWPFLNAFFNKFSLLHTNEDGEQEFINEDAQLKAHALLVNILAESVSEKVYAVANLLTGLEPDTLVETGIELEQVEKEACKQLLHAVIDNWKALKVMPIASFREMFLQREVICSTSELGYTLAVNNKAQDILITKLPWGMGTITLPWLGKQLIQVEWQYGY